MHHITRCASCQQELADLQLTHSLLDDIFYEDDCYDEEELLAYQAGFLPRARKKIIQQHLVTCAPCTQFVAHLTQMTTQPDPLLTRLIETGKRILTALLQPAAPQPVFALLGQEEKQLTYHAGDYQLILTMLPFLPGTDLTIIEGHIINHANLQESYDGTIFLYQEKTLIVEETIDDFGFFVFEELTPGNYTLQVELAHIIIPIEGLTIP